MNTAMAKNSNLQSAKDTKNDEFYTQYSDVQAEINAFLEYDANIFRDKTILLPCDDPEWSSFTKYFAAHFEEFGIKKLISTSYASDAKKEKYGLDPQISIWELNSPNYDEQKSKAHGKIFTLERGKTADKNNDKIIDIDDLDFEYLEGDGDFRSEEVIALRDQCDFIITNPPFSLFREFMAWIMEAEKKFIIIGNMGAITYKEIFPLIKENKIWLGIPFKAGNAYFKVANVRDYANGVYDESTGLVKFRNCCWFTNAEHGRRHEPLESMSMADQKRFSKHKEIRDHDYQKYDNYNAIEVPFTDSIPNGYTGIMGVPISFLDRYNPQQFEILGMTTGRSEFSELAYPTKRYVNAIQHNSNGSVANGSKANTRACLLVDEPSGTYYTADNADGKLEIVYARILIRFKQSWIDSHPEDFGGN